MLDSQTLIDTGWLLGCSVLVFLMQAGFCCLETGFVRSKNSINVAIKNIVDFAVSSAMFGLIGATLAFGASWYGLIGLQELTLDTPQSQSRFLFQLMFCGTTTTIVSGAVAERMRFAGYLVVAALVSGLIYPLSAHWVWAGALTGSSDGWLAQRGFVDFAGSTVVHAVGGTVALVACLIIGPRKSRFDSKWVEQTHNIPMSALGVLILWCGWYGFNGGSTFALNGLVPQIMLNTTIAGAGGLLGAMVLGWIVKGQPDVRDLANGALAGLVAVTAGCHAVDTSGAWWVGAIGGLFATLCARVLERLEIDDAVGAIPVHAAAGIWGTIAVAVFGDPVRLGTGLGPASQLLVQVMGVAVCCGWAALAGFILITLAGKLLRLRVTTVEEMVGLNVAEHGATTDFGVLLTEMEQHRRTGNLLTPVSVETDSEVGQVAAQYNAVLRTINSQQQQLEATFADIEFKNKDLEDAKTALAQKLDDLEEFNRCAVERELRMVELKQEVDGELISRGSPPRYGINDSHEPEGTQELEVRVLS